MDPFFHIAVFTIPAYGVFAALAMVSAGGLIILRAKRLGIDPDTILIIVCCALICAIFGAKLLYIFASYGIEQVLRDLRQGSLDFLRSGGMVFYGGLLGGIAGAFLGIAVTKERRKELLANAILPVLPLGHAIGRIGCLFAGCCYGLPYDGPGSVFLTAIEHPHRVFPLPLVEAGGDLLLCGMLLLLSRRKQSGLTLLYLYLGCYAGMRFVLEFFRGDLIRGVMHGLSTSQWISLLLLAGSLLWACREKISKKSEADKT